MKESRLDRVLRALQQESTWRGITAVLTATRVIVDPSQAEKIIACGLFVIGTINILKDK